VGREIERKFLVADERWRAGVTRSIPMEQGYLLASGECSVRVRIEGDEARLNIKSATLGIERDEFDYPIPRADAELMLARLCGRRTLRKRRHLVPHCGHVWEVDEFEGANRGLVVAEVELERADEPFAPPAWLGAEVSHDRRYYNVCLVEHPYCEWDEQRGR
jgi:adenylate cyclase